MVYEMTICYRHFARLIGAYVGPSYGFLCLSFHPISLAAALHKGNLGSMSCDCVGRMFVQVAEAVECECKVHTSDVSNAGCQSCIRLA